MAITDRHANHRGKPPSRIGALRNRNFRLFWLGQTISLVGTWMQTIGLSWLVYQVSGSAVALGVVMAVQFLPLLVLAPLGGLLADHYPKRWILVATQSASIVPALCLWGLASWSGTQVWELALTAAFLGTINAFDNPARQAFVMDMVGPSDLLNAIALNSGAFNAAQVLGPAIAGVLIAFLGIRTTFFCNAISFLPVIAALLAMRGLPQTKSAVAEGPWRRLAGGAAYVRGEPQVALVLIAVSGFSLFAMNRMTLMPIFAKQVLDSGSQGFGFLMAAGGLGALLGAISLAVLRLRGPSGRLQFASGMVALASMFAFAISRNLLLSLVLLMLVGFFQIWFLAVSNTRIQVAVPNALRGRVMAIYSQGLLGVTPVGSLLAGALAAAWGAPASLAIGAALAAAVLVAIAATRPWLFELGNLGLPGA